jgi:hypothetical protein
MLYICTIPDGTMAGPLITGLVAGGEAWGLAVGACLAKAAPDLDTATSLLHAMGRQPPGPPYAVSGSGSVKGEGASADR